MSPSSVIFDVEAWLTSISMSPLNLFPGLWFDISPCFLTTLREIADWLRLASPEYTHNHILQKFIIGTL